MTTTKTTRARLRNAAVGCGLAAGLLAGPAACGGSDGQPATPEGQATAPEETVNQEQAANQEQSSGYLIFARTSAKPVADGAYEVLISDIDEEFGSFRFENTETKDFESFELAPGQSAVFEDWTFTVDAFDRESASVSVTSPTGEVFPAE